MAPASTLPLPPALPGHRWRAARPDDLAAVRALQLACAEAAGHAPDRSADPAPALGAAGRPPTDDTICAVAADGRIAAFGWVRIAGDVAHEYRIGLFGQVHPDYRRRGLGCFLLAWTEARGRQLPAARPPDRPAILRVDCWNARPDAERLYARRGFQRRFGEYRMQRDLGRPVVEYPLPGGLRLVPWTAERAGLFFAVHEDAWSTRPGYQGSSAAEWSAYWAGDDDFRADLSLLALDGDEGAGLLLCDVDSEASAGWISKVGVSPRWRRRGLASALMGRALSRLRAEGLGSVALDVGDDNPDARRLYERLGFAVVGHRTVYGKTV